MHHSQITVSQSLKLPPVKVRSASSSMQPNKCLRLDLFNVRSGNMESSQESPNLSLLLLQQLLVDIVAILVKHLLHGMNIIFHLSLCLENSVSIPQILKISPHSSYSCLLSLFAPCAAKVVRIFTFATYFQLLVCFFSV